MSHPTTPVTRYTLRHLPFASKLVLTVFLLAVGLGYVSAMVQLHMQHSERDGEPLPTVDNVIAVFAGKKRPSETGERNCCQLESILSGSPDGELTSKNMVPAFFAEDGADYQDLADKNPAGIALLRAERDGERKALIAWLNEAPETRKTTYDADKFPLPKELVGQPLSKAYKSDPAAVRVKSILQDRCVRCHKPGGDKSDIPLTTVEELEKYLPTETAIEGGWVDSGKQMSLEKLTQSTHAHLLSFAVLFGITGFIFAFTSYPGFLRVGLAPIVLIAQVVDIACWWLARLPAPYGPTFAMCIIGTGAIVGLGLVLQILLSVFNMYGLKGKLVLVLLLLLAGAGAGVVAKTKVLPFLEVERSKLAAKTEAVKKEAAKPKPNGAKPPPAKVDVKAGPSLLERILDGRYPDAKWGDGQGGMVQAFFEKDGADFRKVIKSGEEDEKKQLIDEREGERAVVMHWIRLAESDRKAAYAADKVLLPPALAAKPLTADYKGEGGSVKIQTILNDRCVRCHVPGGDKEDVPLETYENLLKALAPRPADDAKPTN